MSDKDLIDKQIIAYVKTWRHHSDIQIDDDAEVSRSEDGRSAWVQGWVYVDLSEVDTEEEA